jgi:hypothetical protein
LEGPFGDNEGLLGVGAVEGDVRDGEDGDVYDAEVCEAFALARSESLEGTVGLGRLEVTEISGCAFPARSFRPGFEAAEVPDLEEACSRSELRSETRPDASDSKEGFEAACKDFLCSQDNF